MKLISTARALDDQHFKWRVQAACIIKAGTFATMPVGPDRNFALTILLNPQLMEMSMIAFVAMDDVVANAMVVGADNETVETDTVLDSDITRVVNAKWSLVANKYPTDPLA
jgi:hypothetical protein